VVDNSFAIDTTDPQRAFDPTASIVDRAVYDTLFTYRKNDLQHPVPLLVRSWTSRGARTFTFRLRRDVHFADGTPLTSADVVFSLGRLVNLKGHPAFLLAGVEASAQPVRAAHPAHPGLRVDVRSRGRGLQRRLRRRRHADHAEVGPPR
jgi:peptide/nickel transport system substrate-binding protein